MGTYKVIQDIEAEDKLLGPLTLKQFIFAIIAVGFAAAAFFAVTQTGSIFVAIPFLPFIAVPGILAAPLGRDQPTDVWLAAQIRFFIKPRKRTWSQSGIKNLVTITVPKKVEQALTNGLNQDEVKSRLRALADTIDSRGWAIKSVSGSSPMLAGAGSDRLIDISNLPQSVPDTDITAADDIMDVTSNPLAQHFDTMVQASATAQKNAAIEHMRAAATNNQPSTPSNQQADPWFMHQPDPSQIPAGNAMFSGSQTIHPSNQTTQDDSATLNLKAPKPTEAQDKTVVTPPKNPDIVELAKANDLSVASVAHLANRKGQSNDGEVVINLH